MCVCIYILFFIWGFFCVCVCVHAVVCHSGADAGAHVQAQDLQPQPSGLSEDMPVPEVAENGGSTR